MSYIQRGDLTICSLNVLILKIEQYMNIKGDRDMDATRYLKDSLALLGLFGVIYLWSVVAYALQV